MDYGYHDDSYVNLTMEEILLRVNQEEIFYMVTGEIPDTTQRYLSYVRADTYGDCYFTYYDNKLYFVDYGYKIVHMDCFNLVQEVHSLTFKQALAFINNELSLGLNGTGIPVPVVNEPFIRVESKRKHTDILFRSRPFSKRDIIFWGDYGITKDNLFNDGVMPVLWYKFYSKTAKSNITIRPLNIYPTYAYAEFTPRVKLYSPFKPKKKGKWIGNVTQNDIGGLAHLPIRGDILVITKGYKDWRVLMNFGIWSVWFQNEGMIPDLAEIVSLCKRFEYIIVLFDNDEAGINASNRVVSTLNSHFPLKASSILIPSSAYDEVTDISDFYKERGKFELISFLTQYNLL